MKKIIGVLVVLFVIIIVSGCNVQASGNNNAIPTRFRTLEFWNGGSCIAYYENVSMTIEIATTFKVWGKDVYYYLYHIQKPDGSIETIMDSEALALKWTVR